VEISLGYGGSLLKVMLAEITGLEPSFAMGRTPTLTVRGYDHRHRLTRMRRTRSFSGMKDSAIARQLAREAGLRAEVKDTKVALSHVVQPNQTDLEFLRARAGRIGYEVLHFRPPRHADRAVLTLSLDDDIVEFTPRLTAMGQVGEVTVRGWDVKQKKEIVGKASIGQESSTMGGRATGPRAAQRALGKGTTAVVVEPVRSKAEADQIALGELDDVALGYVQGEVTCFGQARLRAGAVVDIRGAGTTLSGPYYVTTVVHTVTPDDGYLTSFEVRRNAT
jgi:phage protein D